MWEEKEKTVSRPAAVLLLLLLQWETQKMMMMMTMYRNEGFLTISVVMASLFLFHVLIM